MSTMYRCNRDTFECEESESGGYYDIETCENQCIEKFRCNNVLGRCVSDINGRYNTLNECTNNCQQTIDKYSCNTEKGQCAIDTNGTYLTINECNNNCEKDRTLLWVGLGIGGFILFLLFVGGVIYILKYNKTSEGSQGSVDSQGTLESTEIISD